jgi:hypothetical protein
MNNIECSNIVQIPNPETDLMMILESISNVPIKVITQDVVTLTRTEDKIYEIPSSVVEIIYQNSK